MVTPGPAAYRVGPLGSTIKPRSPAFSLGPRLAYKPVASNTPGPGQYETLSTF